jgi:hypothetical protein
LGSNLWFLVESGSRSNLWIFLSLITVLCVFSLQTTSVGFLYLYPVKRHADGNGTRKTVGIDTWILRVLMMATLSSLYLGILHDYRCWYKWWLIIPGIIFILIIPVVFNMGISDRMRERATKGRSNHENVE